MKKINFFIFVLVVFTLLIFVSVILIIIYASHNTTIPVDTAIPAINDTSNFIEQGEIKLDVSMQNSSTSNQNIEQYKEIQNVIIGEVLSVSGSEFVMTFNNSTVVVAMNPDGLMYISKRGSRVSQSFIKPGHKVRIVTDNPLDSSVIKPLIIEDFSLPLK